MIKALVRALASIGITTVLLTGGVLAIEGNLFTSDVVITIEPVTGSEEASEEAFIIAPLEVLGVNPSSGTWFNGVWSVDILAGESARLDVLVGNPSSEPVTVVSYLSQAIITEGVTIRGLSNTDGWSNTGQVVESSSNTTISFIIQTDNTSAGGLLSGITVKVAEY